MPRALDILKIWLVGVIDFCWFWGVRNITSEVCGQLSIAEPSCRLVVDEISSVRREVCLDKRHQSIIVSYIYNRVTKDAESRNQRLSQSPIVEGGHAYNY